MFQITKRPSDESCGVVRLALRLGATVFFRKVWDLKLAVAFASGLAAPARSGLGVGLFVQAVKVIDNCA